MLCVYVQNTKFVSKCPLLQAERIKAKEQEFGQGRLMPKQATKLLKRFPNLEKEV